MIRNYIIIAWRNFVKHRTFSFINIVGFALAMASCFLIIFHIKSELSYEKIYPNHKNIYRFHVLEWAKSSPPMAQAVADFFPEVKSTARFFEFGDGSILSYNDYQTIIGNSMLADSTAIDMFNYEFVAGDPKASLRVPFTSILTESLAKRVFGNAHDAVGKTIVLNGDTELAITGVIKDVPENTHIQFEMLTSFSSFYKFIPENWASNKGWMAPYTYLELDPAKVASFEARIPDFQVKFYEGWDTPEKLRATKQLGLTPIDDIHLYSHLEQEMSANSNASYLYIFAGVAVFILFIASVNFINLNISLAFRRIKETGLRKVMGAVRIQLIKQYLAETLVTSFVGLLIALGLFFAVIPNYNALAGRDVHPGDVITFENILVMAALIVGVSLLSGAYPAFFMSRFKPTDALKSQRGPGSSTPFVRKTLVVFQFAVSAFMIASTIIIIRQMNYFRNQDLGFNKDQVLVVDTNGDKDKLVLQQEVSRLPNVKAVSLSGSVPGSGYAGAYSEVENSKGDLQITNLDVYFVDFDYIPLYNIKMAAGRPYNREFKTDTTQALILNEAAVRVLGYHSAEQAIGKRFKQWGREGKIVGVIKDFHYKSLQNPIKPLCLRMEWPRMGLLSVKVSSTNVKSTVAAIEKKFRTIIPNRPFSYYFMDEFYDRQYRSEERFGRLFLNFAVLAIFISCLGLLGLASYSTMQRTREIGIRKVMGASVSNIINLLSKEFLKLVVISFFIASPVAWYFMHKWLNDFAYRTQISWWFFAVAGILALLIAVITISVQAFRAAVANPVKSLRTE